MTDPQDDPTGPDLGPETGSPETDTEDGGAPDNAPADLIPPDAPGDPVEADDFDPEALFDELDDFGDFDEDEDFGEEEAVGGFRQGDFVFYPQIGHCDVGSVILDDHTGLEFLELTPLDAAEGNRILVPVAQLGNRGIRHSGTSPGVIEEILGSDFEPTIEDASERLDLITAQERDGSVASLALALKRLHLRHEMKTITREEQKRRTRIRKWLVVEYMAEKDRTTGQAQSAITRLLGKTMKAVREREREAAREKRRLERAERKKAAAAKRAAKRARQLARLRRM